MSDGVVHLQLLIFFKFPMLIPTQLADMARSNPTVDLSRSNFWQLCTEAVHILPRLLGVWMSCSFIQKQYRLSATLSKM